MFLIWNPGHFFRSLFCDFVHLLLFLWLTKTENSRPKHSGPAILEWDSKKLQKSNRSPILMSTKFSGCRVSLNTVHRSSIPWLYDDMHVNFWKFYYVMSFLFAHGPVLDNQYRHARLDRYNGMMNGSTLWLYVAHVWWNLLE